MKRTIEPNLSTQTELAQLRELLTETERQIIVMQQTPTGARDVIRSLDEIERLLVAVRETRVDTRAEENRADFLRRRLAGGAPGVVRLVQAAELTEDLHGSPTWETVLAAQADQSRKRVRRLLTLGLPVLAVMLTIIVLTLLFPPPPQANLTNVRTLTQNGRLDEALAEAQAEATQVPTDPEAAMWVGVLHSITGDDEGAEAAWENARRLLGDDARFHFERGTTLLEIGQPDRAEADARRLMEEPESAPAGYLLLGGVEEMRGRVPEAIAAFEEASALANARGNSQLEVIAKARLGILMQSGGGGIILTPTP
jgi:tetratricopeptide (TPR) repeat protein